MSLESSKTKFRKEKKVNMIIIIGDSWGVGEYTEHLSGPGIGQYIAMDNRVINLSRGGASNTDCLDRLQLLFEQFNPQPVDRFFWIVTCPCRCLNNYHGLKNITVSDLAEQLLYSVLNRANGIAESASIKIELIGGMCDLSDEHVEYFDNLEILVPSWGKLLDENYPACSFVANPEIFHHTARDQKALDAMENKYNYWTTSDLFPDHAHPNRVCHRILRDTIFPDSACYW
jgi:hypothetical protein